MSTKPVHKAGHLRGATQHPPARLRSRRGQVRPVTQVFGAAASFSGESAIAAQVPMLSAPAPPSINSVAAQCVREAEKAGHKSAPDIWKAANAALTLRVDADPDLFRVLMEPFKAGAIWQAIRGAGKDCRYKTWNQQPDANLKDGGLEAVGRSMLDTFTLPGGKRLGDADGGELMDAAGMYRVFEKENATRARFLEAVAGKLKAGQVVREALTDRDLRKIQRKADQ